MIDEAGLDRVVADPLRFKQKLRIGEDAFALLRAKKNLFALYDTAGAAGTGAAIAGSSVVAGKFFAPAGLAAMLGLATASTPIGWVIAAAVVAGGGYYGASRWLSGKGQVFVDTIPKYINTPIDVLGAALIDLLGALALRVAAIDGKIEPSEKAAIRNHFIEDWGFDADYVTTALGTLELHADETRIKDLAVAIAQFQASNPDCNPTEMQAELMAFLREVVAADGVIDEREEFALETIQKTFLEERRLTFSKVTRTVRNVASGGSIAMKSFGQSASKKASDSVQLFREKKQS
ncbi:TerB family tellurite resistance protein [Qipengyuania sp. JC766]|uniref:tellurite resistance TerB family protein n=1 Tax=Qipengyuania sp. JC766 TaxID=3232139 RepID=UPI003458B1C6